VCVCVCVCARARVCRDGWIDRGREARERKRGRRGGGRSIDANGNCITGVHVGLLLRYVFMNLPTHTHHAYHAAPVIRTGVV
jgi:hypothetical protein